jgi:hypothetical protein
VRNATLTFLSLPVCVLAVACSGASNILAEQDHDSGDTPPVDSGAPPGDSGMATDSASGGDTSVSPESGGTCSPTLPDGAACNSIEPSGPLVPYQCIMADMPSPAGGTIRDGTYRLMTSAFYGSPCPAPEDDRDTWLICGSVWQTAQELTAGTNPPVIHTYDGNVTPDDEAGPGNLIVDLTCGVVTSYVIQYSATPTSLTLFVGGGMAPSQGRVDTYSRL